MFSLAVGFALWMRKWTGILEGEATSSSGEKRPRRSPLDEGAQKDWAIVLMDSSDLTFDDQPALRDSPIKANTPLEEGVPAMSPLDVEEVRMDAPSRVVTALAPLPKSTDAGLRKKRLPDQVLVSMYVWPLERVHHSTDVVVPDLEDVLKIAHRWNPLNQEETLVTHMRDLYLNYFWIPVLTCLE